MGERNERRILPENVKGWRLPGEPSIWAGLNQVPRKHDRRSVTEFRVLYGGKWRKVVGVQRKGLATYLRIV